MVEEVLIKQSLKEKNKSVVLFVHGILGSPKHFEKFFPLIPKNFDYQAMLLAGHGKSGRDFIHSNKPAWELSFARKINELKTDYDNIYIVAHSMGTLLSLNYVDNNDEKIKEMLLLSVPLRTRLSLKGMVNSLKIAFCKDKRLTKEQKRGKEVCSVQNKNLITYIRHVPRFFDLWKISRKTRNICHKINVNTTVFFSKNDEVVSKKSIETLKNEKFTVKILENSSHYCYAEEDFQEIISVFCRFFS